MHPFLGIILVPMTDAQVRSGQFRLWWPKLPWLPCLAGGRQRAGFSLDVHSSNLKILLHSNFYKHPL